MCFDVFVCFMGGFVLRDPSRTNRCKKLPLTKMIKPPKWFFWSRKKYFLRFFRDFPDPKNKHIVICCIFFISYCEFTHSTIPSYPSPIQISLFWTSFLDLPPSPPLIRGWLPPTCGFSYGKSTPEAEPPWIRWGYCLRSQQNRSSQIVETSGGFVSSKMSNVKQRKSSWQFQFFFNDMKHATH